MLDIEDFIKKTNKIILLYVEDNQEARESTLLILEDLFENIVVAVDGADGIEKFKTNNIDIIITDISMPNMDGLDMSKSIRDINTSMPIIILTALTNISVLKEAIDIGVDSFINKPIEDIDILIEKLNLAMQRIDNKIFQEEIILLNQQKEKTELIVSMLKNIVHHWRQPLSVISTISSGYTFKAELGEDITLKDLKNAEIITQKTEELSLLLEKIEKIEVEKISSKDIKELIEISNPIIIENV